MIRPGNKVKLENSARFFRGGFLDNERPDDVIGCSIGVRNNHVNVTVFYATLRWPILRAFNL